MDRDSPEIEDTNAMNVDNEEKQSNNVGLSAEEDDEEYEIEEILDAKRGAFANVSCSFRLLSFVSAIMTRIFGMFLGSDGVLRKVEGV